MSTTPESSTCERDKVIELAKAMCLDESEPTVTEPCYACLRDAKKLISLVPDGLVIVPADRVPDAETIAAIRGVRSWIEDAEDEFGYLATVDAYLATVPS